MFARTRIPLLRTGFRAPGRELSAGSETANQHWASFETTAPVNVTVPPGTPARVGPVLDVAAPPTEPVDDGAIRAEVVGFLDRAEARSRRRPEWIGTLDRERVRQTHEVLAELTETKERFTEELRHERAANRRDARLAFDRAEAAAEERVGDAAAEAGRLLDAARNDARELVRRAQGEAEQTLEWSRAQGADIVRRSQRLARDRFSNDARPWLAADVKRH